MTKLHIKKGDKVKIVAGESKGAEGVVKKIFTETSRVIVDGDKVKKISKHTKPNAANPNGGILKQEASIHISNVMVLDPKSGTPSRIGRKKNAEGKNVRYAKKSGEVLSWVTYQD